MALQIRRGLEINLPASPADGELLYATDTNKLYVGDGGTAQEISGGGGINNIIEDTTPQLGGDLDVSGHSIISTGNGDINIDADGTGSVFLQGTLEIINGGSITKSGELNITPTTVLSIGRTTDSTDGNVYITRDSYSNVYGQGFYFAQHHATQDATNFTFYRSRGTGASPTAVLNGDDLADISFIGWDGTSRIAGAQISVIVDGAPTTGAIPGKIAFATNNGSSIANRAELSSAGIWKVNSIAPFSGTTLSLTSGNLVLNAQADLRFADADSSNYVAFQAPSTVTSNVTWTLPSADGTAGYVLSTDGAGTLNWVAQSGGGGTSLQSRNTVAATTASLADTATGSITFTGAAKGYVLYKIETSAASWVRLYTDISSRTADASRAEGVDPAAGAGVVAEVITTGAQTILISPGTLGFNNEFSPSTEIYAAVTNKSGSTTTITVTLTILKIEV